MTSQRVGRPPVEGITDALLAAAERTMVRDGYSALTVEALTTAVGTTRPTFYRRFPSVAHLALAVIQRRFGAGGGASNGSLNDDVLTLQREEVAMFSNPLLSKNLLGLLAAAEHDESLRDAYHSGFVGPRRQHVAELLEAAAHRGEVARPPSAEQVDLICDLLVGPILSRALLPTGAPLDDRLAVQTAQAALHHLRTA